MTKRIAKQLLAPMLVMAVAGLTISGCGGTETGSIKGKVIYKDKLLSTGTVTFIGADNKVVSSPILTDGSYRIDKIAVGEAKIGVIQPSSTAVPAGRKMMSPDKMDAPSGQSASSTTPAGKPVALPKQYQNPATSGVTYTVKAGAQDKDVELK